MQRTPQSPNEESKKKGCGVRPPYQMAFNLCLFEDDVQNFAEPQVPVRMFLWRAVEIKYHEFIVTVCEAQKTTQRVNGLIHCLLSICF